LDFGVVTHLEGPFGSTIHTIPRLTPTETYDAHMEDIHASALRQAYGNEAPSLKVLHSKTQGGTARTRDDRPGFVFGFGFVCAVVVVCLFYSMMKSGTVLHGKVWVAVDHIICAFLANTWVNAVDSMLTFYNVSGKYAVLVSGIHVLLVLTLVLFLSFQWQQHRQATVIFMAAAGHYVVFCSIHFATKSHQRYFSESDWWALAGFGALFFMYGITLVVLMLVRKSFGSLEPEMVEKVDEVEDNFMAIGLAVAWGLVVRAWIASGLDNGNHTKMERWMMLIYSLIMIPVAVCLTWKIATHLEQAGTNQIKKRALRTFSAFLAMSATWGFIMWGEWEFHEHLFQNSNITGGLIFAIMSTLVGASGVVMLSRVHLTRNSQLERSCAFANVCIAYFIAIGWSTCVSAALEDLAVSYTHHGVVKLWFCVLLFVVVIPPYVTYFREDMAVATKQSTP